MMQNIASEIVKGDPLVKLVQEDNFVGWIYKIDYGTAHVMTNDLWKAKALAVPHNCFLVAALFDPNEFAKFSTAEREVILLRVVGSAKLPQDDDLVRAKIDRFQNQTDMYSSASTRDYDDITRNQMQFHGLECHVLGTFYTRDNQLWLGSDLESFASAASLNVYRPRADALKIIVNYVDPIRLEKAREEARELGIQKEIKPFQIGTVRYTSTDRLHRPSDKETSHKEKVPVSIQPSDFLARRTAVLGMTRTGKSNMVKQLVSVVKRVADESDVKIGQIIYDINGEYANANQQDKGAIADIYPKDTFRYRMVQTQGFQELRNNFYEQLNDGFSVIRRELEAAGRVTSDYIRPFINMSLDEPDSKVEREHSRWERRVAAYRVLLYKAGFEPPKGYKIKFAANKEVQQAVEEQATGKEAGNKQQELADNKPAKKKFPDPAFGLTLSQAAEWFETARKANEKKPLPSSTKGKLWVDDTLQNLLDMIAQKAKKTNNYISGYRILADAVKYHSPHRSSDVAEEIYKYLVDGKIVILDLSVGDPTLRGNLSKQVAERIFNNSMREFIKGKGHTPPNIVVYIEEAHNLIGKGMELTETWPRLAKEGAKYRIGLVYATQEVSSVHPNILSNTENWFVTHLNNENEIKVLAKFYDFEDFSRSLIRAQDVGFARVKTLSSPFVVPVQIDKFDPDREKQRVAQIHQAETEKVNQNNQAAIQLLRTWAEEGDEQEQKETWEYLSRNLGKDRTSI